MGAIHQKQQQGRQYKQVPIQKNRAARGQRRGLPIGIVQEKQEEIWLSPTTNTPTPTEESKMQQDNTKNATKNFDYTTIADRLRTEMEMQMGLPTTSIYRNSAHLSGQLSGQPLHQIM